MRKNFVLKDKASVGYSPNERVIFELLTACNGQGISTPELVKSFYKGKTPFYGRQIVVGLLSSIRRKAVANREPFRVVHTPRSGPIPMSFWLEEKKPK